MMKCYSKVKTFFNFNIFNTKLNHSETKNAHQKR